jgi:hypothetical protein
MQSLSWHSARNWRFRAEEMRSLAADMMNDEPKAIMLRIAADYEMLAEWAERASEPSTEKFTRHVRSVEQGR